MRAGSATSSVANTASAIVPARNGSGSFAGRSDKEEPRFVVVRETPLVDGALAHFVARVERSYWGGDHSLFLGRVEYARQNPGTPLLFHGGRYEKLGA